MQNKKLIGGLVLVLALAAATVQSPSCIGTGSGQGIEALESMTELQFSKWKMYIGLGVKIGANRLLKEKTVTAGELEVAATALETVRDQTLVPGATSFVKDALKEAGLTNDEVELLLIIVEQELVSRGALDWINPETNMLELSPRTKEMLTIVANALRSATLVTEQEVQQGKQLESQFNGKIL